MLDLPVLQVKALIAAQLIVDHLFHDLVKVDGPLLHLGQTLPDAHDPQTQVLGGNQDVLVKKGYLDAAASHIHDGSSLLDDFLEGFLVGSDGLVPQETLFRVA